MLVKVQRNELKRHKHAVRQLWGNYTCEELGENHRAETTAVSGKEIAHPGLKGTDVKRPKSRTTFSQLKSTTRSKEAKSTAQAGVTENA